MDKLNSPFIQVVLDIKEGNGFGFIKSPILLVATLNGSKLETNEVQPSVYPQFHTELAWQADKKYIRRLRSDHTAVKLECFTVVDDKREKIGYVLLKLKTAQIVTPGTREVLLWYRLLGVKKVSKGYTPEVSIKFKIEDISECKERIQAPNDEGSGERKLPNCETGDGLMVEEQVSPRRFYPLQIGPPHLCTELYQFSIAIVSLGNLLSIIPEGAESFPLSVHYAVMGLSILNDDLSQFRDNMNNGTTTLQLWTKLHFLNAYFKDFPNICLKLLSNKDLLGTGQINLQEFGTLTNKSGLKLSSQVFFTLGCNPEKSPSDVFIEMEVSLCHMKDYISVKMDQETQSNYDISPRCLESGDGPSRAPSAESHQVSDLSMELRPEEEQPEQELDQGEPSQLYDQESDPVEVPFPNVRPPEAFSPCGPSSRLDQRRDIGFEEAAAKAVEELEDWKERQEELFKAELRKKTDRHLKKLSHEWVKRKQHLEDELTKRIEECQHLKEKLNRALQDLSQRNDRLTYNEEQLRSARDELEKAYNLKFHELRKASKLHEYDMEDKVNQVVGEKAELMKKLEENGKEILRLQQALLIQESPNHLTKEQQANLISEMKILEEKLEKALESKAFFKEQWGKAVRELHLMKEEEQHHLRWQIQKNRQELQTLGLVQEITQEVGEMKKDQSSIKTIRSQLVNFIHSCNSNPRANVSDKHKPTCTTNPLSSKTLPHVDVDTSQQTV